MSKESEALEEARYWFLVSDVVDFMELLGKDKVFDDLSYLYDQRTKIVQKRKEAYQDFDDVPF